MYVNLPWLIQLFRRIQSLVYDEHISVYALEDGEVMAYQGSYNP